MGQVCSTSISSGCWSGFQWRILEACLMPCPENPPYDLPCPLDWSLSTFFLQAFPLLYAPHRFTNLSPPLSSPHPPFAPTTATPHLPVPIPPLLFSTVPCAATGSTCCTTMDSPVFKPNAASVAAPRALSSGLGGRRSHGMDHGKPGTCREGPEDA